MNQVHSSPNTYPTEPNSFFDQTDDDFPYKEGVPNTRTFWRPGFRLALQFCRLFSHQHVYATAQGSYTENVMKVLDPNRQLFKKVIHRDRFPKSVRKGKDMSFVTDRMDRVVLFDDRPKNFKPQEGNNGIHIGKFTQVGKDNSTELMEAGRMVGISLLALLASDVEM
jgi:hypothetical protein